MNNSNSNTTLPTIETMMDWELMWAFSTNMLTMRSLADIAYDAYVDACDAQMDVWSAVYNDAVSYITIYGERTEQAVTNLAPLPEWNDDDMPF